MADADLARELAQRQLAALVERLLGGLEQRGAEVAVVVGAGRDGHAGILAVHVGVDSIVVSRYIVPHDNFQVDSQGPSLARAGRTVVITGANSGIGLAAARELGRAGAHVVLAVRDEARGATPPRSRSRARPRSGGSTSPTSASVHAFADGFEGDIDVLINNAGVMAIPESRTADGFEMQIGTNHLGHFALANLLLPRIRDRVVVVASGAHRMGQIRLDDLNWEQGGYKSWRAYGQSKLANLLFTSELQRRLAEAGSDVRAVAAHPGYAATNLQSHTGNGSSTSACGSATS